MLHNPYDNYLEARVLSASPVELVAIAYQTAIDELECARSCIVAGDIAGRGRHASKASALIAELAQSLDESAGGELARQLRELYAYLLQRIQYGNFHQSDSPFAESCALLRTLLEGWQTIQPQPDSTLLDAEFSHFEVSV